MILVARGAFWSGIDCSCLLVGRRIRTAEREPELLDIEREIDRVLQAQRVKATTGDENALDVTPI